MARFQTLLSLMIGISLGWPATAPADEPDPWQAFRARGDYSALGEEVFAAVTHRMATEPDGNSEEATAFFQQMASESRQLDQTFHRLQNAFDQRVAAGAQAASYLTANRRERRFLQGRLIGLIQEFERTRNEVATLDKLVTQTDEILRMRMRNSQNYYLARGFVEVPKHCEDGPSPPDYVSLVRETARQQALEQPLAVAQDPETRQLFESLPKAVKVVPGEIVLRLPVQSESSATEPGADDASPAADQIYRIFLLAVLEVQASNEGLESSLKLPERPSTAKGCTLEEFTAKTEVHLETEPPESLGWPQIWSLSSHLAAEDAKTLNAHAHEIFEFWRSLGSDLNTTYQRGWVEDRNASRSFIQQQRTAVREVQSALATEIIHLESRLQATTTIAMASEQDQSHITVAREREKDLHKALRSGVLTFAWPIVFRAPPETPEEQAIPALEKSLRDALEDARHRYAAKIAPYLKPVDNPARYVVAKLKAFFPLGYDIGRPDADGQRSWSLNIALRFEMRLRDGILAPNDIFTVEDRRRLAEFLPSDTAPSVIVDRLIWRVPNDRTRELTWFQAGQNARKLPARDGCSSWRLPTLEELKSIARPNAENCTIFPELGLGCDDRVWASERMGESDNYRALTFVSTETQERPREGFNGSTNLKTFAVCEPDWSDLDVVPQLPEGATELAAAADGSGS